MVWLVLVIAALAAWAATHFGTGMVLGALERRAILDRPGARSSHATPTPRGGGLAVIAAVVVVWAAGALALPGASGAVGLILALAVALAAISWLDDLRGLAVAARLATQVAVVALGLLALPQGGLVFQGLLPPSLDLVLAGLLWLWFVNLFNFMDGIDGITGVESTCIGLGLCLVALAAGWRADAALFGLSLAAAAAGFLRWNWHPARIFLGDVGSVPLGYLLGWLLLWAAADGLWAPALLLPLYYVADATITLGRRLLRRERVWQAHRDHFYQRAARAAGSHAPVARAVLIANLPLIALALLAALAPPARAPSLILGGAVVGLLLWYLRRQSTKASHAD